MSAAILWLGGRAGRWLAGLMAALAALMAVYLRGRLDGAHHQNLKAKEADHEAAADLRRRVDRNLDQRVREMEGRGFRD